MKEKTLRIRPIELLFIVICLCFECLNVLKYKNKKLIQSFCLLFFSLFASNTGQLFALGIHQGFSSKYFSIKSLSSFLN